MEWSSTSATKAYLDTLELCNNRSRQCESCKTQEPGSNEFVSALAAGVRAKLIVEVTSSVSPSTIALATAAKHTGGKLVSIVPEPVLAESKQVIKDSGLKDLVEFRTGDPSKELPSFENIDFSLIDCRNDNYSRLLKLLDVNPDRSVVVANNLNGDKMGLNGHLGGMKEKVAVRSLKNPIGKGMEVTMICRQDLNIQRNWAGGGSYPGANIRIAPKRRIGKSRWISKLDEDSGEEQIFRVPKSLQE